MSVNILLFVFLLVDFYLALWILLQNNTLSKVKYFVKQKNDKYYQELMKQYQKSKKVKLKMKKSFFQKISLLMKQAGLKSRSIDKPYFYSFSIHIVICFRVYSSIFFTKK